MNVLSTCGNGNIHASLVNPLDIFLQSFSIASTVGVHDGHTEFEFASSVSQLPLSTSNEVNVPEMLVRTWNVVCKHERILVELPQQLRCYLVALMNAKPDR
ncbi:hypothetical protein V7S43_004644 [Phytophthora oleae]|uniref:Uncharacterized protein n=1 Tax=Phytophthora oleae TaxID=2107226 RepID=A0ABD3FUC3_9STRA